MFFLEILLHLAYLGWKFSQSLAPGPTAVGAVAGPPQLQGGPTRVALGLNDEHVRTLPSSLTNVFLPTIINFPFLCPGNVFPRLLPNVSPVEDFALPLNQREPLTDHLLTNLLIKMFDKDSLSLGAKLIAHLSLSWSIG